MNVLITILVRCLCMLSLCLLAGQVVAQQEGKGLTKDFDKLSAKERSKVAARETKEAAADSSYQAIMRAADKAFQEGRYEDALSTFQQARTLRPYNVYPKVKIQDLQALIKKRDREAVEKAPAPQPAEEAPIVPEMEAPQATTAPASPSSVPLSATAPEPDVPEASPAQRIPHVASTPDPIEEALPAPVEEKRPPVHSAPAPEARPAPIGERVYMEAGAVVTERTVEDDGKAKVYKKVSHSWGRTFYFKDGHAISDREWKERFKE